MCSWYKSTPEDTFLALSQEHQTFADGRKVIGQKWPAKINDMPAKIGQLTLTKQKPLRA